MNMISLFCSVFFYADEVANTVLTQWFLMRALLLTIRKDHTWIVYIRRQSVCRLILSFCFPPCLQSKVT